MNTAYERDKTQITFDNIYRTTGYIFLDQTFSTWVNAVGHKADYLTGDIGLLHGYHKQPHIA